VPVFSWTYNTTIRNTGPLNRLALNQFFDRELNIAKRWKSPLGVAMADLDLFKKVNDTFGHPAGDEVLRAFSVMMQELFRVSDICCRYGGEEFVMVLPELTLEDTSQRTEALRKRLEEADIESGPARLHLTATFGIAMYPDHGESREALIAAADQALYEGKTAGRNRVMRYCAA
jgi:diguanylate cyclase (GGDEF)-like protein